MNRTDRLHAIAAEVRRAGGRGRTSEALADRLEVSVRTVKRDITALQEAGYPIRGAAGPGGGYVMEDGMNLPPVNFTAAEAVAVAVAVTLASASGQPFAVDGRSALAKLLEAMTPGQRERAEHLAGRVWTKGTGNRRGQAVAVIENALDREVAVSFTYTDVEGHSTRRTVDPIYLGIAQDILYLFGWDHGRKAGRSFRVDRISRASLTRTTIRHGDFAAAFDQPIPADVRPVLGAGSRSDG